MGNPLIAGFVEIQHELKTWAWSSKTTEGQASPSYCNKAAKMMSDEAIHLWNLVLNFSSELIFIFTFNDDGAM
jgi:hypothetical protein